MNMLSYLFPITLFKGKTAMNTKVEVRELFGVRKLDLDGYPQSGLIYQKYWKNIFFKLKIDEMSNVGNALILGLGGGDLAKIFEKIKPLWKTTFIEIEPEIIFVAKKYFGIDNTIKRTIVIGDAKDYMTYNRSRYDIVIVDLYSGDSVPKFVTALNFLEQVSQALSLNGISILNYASHSFRENDFTIFTRQLLKIFTNVEQYKYKGHPYFIAKLPK